MELKNLLDVEASIKQMLDAFKKELVANVSASTLPQVKPLNEFCCVVSLSTIKANKSILSSEYYLPHIQARYVEKALSSVTTATALAEKVKQMIDTKKVKINKNEFFLNDATVEALKKAYEGSFDDGEGGPKKEEIE